MNNNLTCDPGRIEQFLRQQLSDDEQTAFELHLDDCDDCRRRLEAAAAADDVWSGVREALRGQSPPNSMPDAESDAEPPFNHSSALDLLAPTDDDRMLGRLGTYEVVGVIGSGGMGVVLKALEPALNRYVAIKVLAPHLGGSGAARKRFSREAQAAAAVVHDNVIEIHGVADVSGLPYLVMPYLPGPSLQRRLDEEGPLSLVEILRIGMQAASGLSAAHAQGLVHRDVKPANILLADGVERVKLTDFGLARAADDASLTKTGVIAGTPQYMSPEQARGESVDPRSDLFSLGSVLYAMCTGRAPFRAETSYGVLRRITDEEPRPVREINPDVPEWLCRIIERLMAKRPGDRFESAGEVAELLEGCLAHVQQPTAAPLPWHPAFDDRARGSAARRTEAGIRRRWPIKLLVGAAFAFAAIFAGILITLELNKGTLTIETDADDVAVRVRRGDAVVEKLTVTRAGRQLRVAAGTYVVEIEGDADALSVENGRVTLKRGGTEIVRIVRRETTAREAVDSSEPPSSSAEAIDAGVPASISPHAWGDSVNGLRLAVVADPDSVQVGEVIPLKIIAENTSERTIAFSASDLLQTARAEVRRTNGDQAPTTSILFSGSAPVHHFELRPGQRIVVAEPSLMIVENKEDGESRRGLTKVMLSGDKQLRNNVFVVRYTVRFGEQEIRLHGEGRWTGSLTTGSIAVVASRPSRGENGLNGAEQEGPAREVGQSVAPRAVSGIGADVAQLEGGMAVEQDHLQWRVASPQGATLRWKRDAAGAGSARSGAFVIPARFSAPAGESIVFSLTDIPGSEALELSGSLLAPQLGSRASTFAAHNAIPVEITAEDIEQAAAGNLVVKVVYLPRAEQAEVALAGVESLVTTRLDPGVDPVTEARRRGELLAVLRLGNRLPTEEDLKADDASKVGGNAALDAATTFVDFVPRQVRRITAEFTVNTIAGSPDGKQFAVANGNPTRILMTGGASRLKGDWKPTVEIMALDSEKEIALKLVADEENAVIAGTERVSHIEATALAFSPDGNMLAIGTSIGQVKFFDARTGEFARSLDDKGARLADPETPESWKVVERALGSVRSLAFSPDGRRLAVCGTSFRDFSDVFDGVEELGRKVTAPDRLQVWDVEAGTLTHDLAGHSHARAVVFSPDGKLLVSAGRWSSERDDGAGVILWDAETGAKVRTIEIAANGGVHAVAFSPDGKRMAIGSRAFNKEDDTSTTMVSMVYPATGIVDWRRTLAGWANPKGFTPDGRQVAVQCGGESIQLLDVQTGAATREVKAFATVGEDGRWRDFALLNPDVLVTGGEDNEGRGIVDVWKLSGPGELHNPEDNAGQTGQIPADSVLDLAKQLEQIQTIEADAEAETEESERREALRRAATGYEQFFVQHRSKLAGLYARFYQARCLQRLGDEQQAKGIFQELLELRAGGDAIEAMKETVRRHRAATADQE
jgi:serine/threonine protein kinase/WD40 repeat protein